MNSEATQTTKDDNWDYQEKRVYGHHVVGYLKDTVWFNRRAVTTLSTEFIQTLSDVLDTYSTPQEHATSVLVNFVDTFKSVRQNARSAGLLDLAVAKEMALDIQEDSTRETVCTYLQNNASALDLNRTWAEQVKKVVGSITVDEAVKFITTKMYDDHTQKMKSRIEDDMIIPDFSVWYAPCSVRFAEAAAEKFTLPYFSAALVFYMAYRKFKPHKR